MGKNTLTSGQGYRLRVWLHTKPPEAQKATNLSLAEEATGKFDFQVTHTNINKAKEDLGIRPTDLKPRQQELKPLRTSANRIIARAICHLYTAVGEAAPGDLLAMAANPKR